MSAASPHTPRPANAEPLKQRVCAAFDRAAATYDEAAIVQRHACHALLAHLAPETDPAHILDAGCGTGFGARILRQRWPQAHITGVDFAPTMVERARPVMDECFTADIEALPLPAQQFDLWWSNMSIQWCNAAAVFAEAQRTLRPGGRLAASTLGPETFHEMREAFSGIDAYRHTLHFNEPDAISRALDAAGFRQIELWREQRPIYYPDLKTLLRAIKAIGAQNVGGGGRSSLMGRAAWQKVEAAYERFRIAEGLPATYDIIFACAATI